jgi:hypothetical protein
MVQWLRMSTTGDALQSPEAQRISAKLAQAGGAIERVRLYASPELVDKLEHLEGEEDV